MKQHVRGARSDGWTLHLVVAIMALPIAASAQGIGDPGFGGVRLDAPFAGAPAGQAGPVNAIGAPVGGAEAPNPIDITHAITPLGGIGGGAPPAPGWTVQPSLGLSESYNDNVFLTNTNRKSDWITYFQPGLSVLGNTKNVQASVTFNPTAAVYAQHGNLDFIGENLNGSVFGTVVEDTVFVNLRGFAAVQPSLGGVPNGATGFSATGLNGGGAAGSALGGQGRQTLTQTLDLGITPYAVHRFGDFGTGKIGYSLQNTTTNGRIGNGQNFNGQNMANLPNFVNGNNVNNFNNGTVLTNSETGEFETGSYFGRWKGITSINGSQSSGTGLTNGSYQYLGTQGVGYAINHHLTVFGQVGAEDIFYPGTANTSAAQGASATRIQGAVWAVGTTISPDQDGFVTIGYGSKYGQTSAFFNGLYHVTARTTLSANYAIGLGTDLQTIQNRVASTTADFAGNLVDYNTGAPAFVTNPAGVIGNNNTLYRNKTLTVTGTTQFDRDTLSLTFFLQQQTQLATTVTGANGSNDNLSANLTWVHQLNAATNLLANFGGGYQNGNGQALNANGTAFGNQTFINAQAAITHNLSPTVQLFGQYTFSNHSSNFVVQRYYQNLVLVGITKTF